MEIDDIALKVALFGTIDRATARDISSRYRRHLLSAIKYLHSLREEVDGELGKELVIERSIWRAESDLKWVSACEERLGRPDND